MNQAAVYKKVWGFEAYRAGSPGERRVLEWMNNGQIGAVLGPKGAKVLDAGCGTGRAAMGFVHMGLEVHICDIAPNCLDPEPAAYFESLGRFTTCELTALPYPDDAFDFYFSCDVLEHLPPEEIPLAFAEAARVAKAGYFEIALFDDVHYSQLTGERLHLTLESAQWWDMKAAPHWKNFSRVATDKKVIFRCGN